MKYRDLAPMEPIPANAQFAKHHMGFQADGVTPKVNTTWLSIKRMKHVIGSRLVSGSFYIRVPVE